MEDLALWKELLLGPAGTAAVLLMFAAYYWKVAKPAEDARIERRELALVESQKERDALWATREEQSRADHLAAVQALVDGCKAQIIEVVKSHETQMEMVKQALDNVADAVRNNTEQVRRTAEIYTQSATRKTNGNHLELASKE
jgi:hypothetical protein